MTAPLGKGNRMATKVSLAIRNEAALERARVAAARLADANAVAALDIPTEYQDAAELPVMQLEAVAAYLTALADALAPAPPLDTIALSARFDAMRKEDVLAEAEANGMDVTSRTTKAEAVEWLTTFYAESADDDDTER